MLPQSTKPDLRRSTTYYNAVVVHGTRQLQASRQGWREGVVTLPLPVASRVIASRESSPPHPDDHMSDVQLAMGPSEL